MFWNILVIIGIIIVVATIGFFYLSIYALCKISSEEARLEEEFSIGFLEKPNDK